MSSDSSSGRFSKKYLGSVNKSNHSSSQRSNNAKFLTTGSKVSAPKPLNLPSLRHESSKASPESTCSASGESDHHPTSISTTPTMINRWGSPLQHQQQQQHTTSSSSDSDTKSKESTSSSSPVAHQPSTAASPAWSAISSTTKKVTDASGTSPTKTSAITTIPSPPSGSTPKNTLLSPKKDHVKITVSHHAKPADIPMPFTQASEPSNMSWDEMVSEEMDFNVSVVDDDDDDDIKLEDRESTTTSLEDNDDDTLNESQSLQQQPVSPSDRFTDDYDRSYPSAAKRTSPGSLYNSQPQEAYRHQDRYHHHHHHHHYHDPYHINNNNAVTQGGGKWSSERRGSEHSNTSGYRGQRRPSSSSFSATQGGWNNHNDQQRRVSQDRTKPPSSPQQQQQQPQQQQHPDTSPVTATTLLRRPSTNINNNSNTIYSSSDDRPPEIVAAQRQAMLSAAEQAKKRREADEAERQAAAARARQKALSLAPPSPPKPLETTPPPSPDNHTSKPATSTPAAITILTHAHEDQQKSSNNKQPSATDSTTGTEIAHETTTSPIIKRGTLITSTTASTGTHHLFANKPKAPMTQDEKSWENYVNHIKKTATDTMDDNDGEDVTTTVSDWSSFAERLQRSTEEKKAHKTMDLRTTKEDSLADHQLQQQESEPKSTEETSPTLQQQNASESTTSQSSPPVTTTKEKTTNSIASEPIKPRRFTKPNTRLEKAVYPIFPDAIGRFVIPKPTSLQFMLEPDESDDELLCTLERHYRHRANAAIGKPALDIPPPAFVESKTKTDRVEPSSPPLDDDNDSNQGPVSNQHPTSTEVKEQATPILDNDQVPVSHQQTITTEEKQHTTPHDDALYPKGLPVTDFFDVPSPPKSITSTSIHTTLANLDLPSAYRKNVLPAPHNDHYPLLMYPLSAPPSDLLVMDSEQKKKMEFSVVLLPPGNAHSTSSHLVTGPSTKPHRYGPRRGTGRYRGAGARGGKHHPASSSSSGAGSWRSATVTSTRGGRPTANTA
ncbi:hypothetical protein BCR42DRAFT_421727 [Absidia repens]|uniref:Uncharacterized protein n=1 Tax=Absidia repens TaxID=90262 RepID=A0A1X2I801_9FUNG|nr:hypothetical protein BCR42DRAFT_421727 [Absidia repens]